MVVGVAEAAPGLGEPELLEDVAVLVGAGLLTPLHDGGELRFAPVRHDKADWPRGRTLNGWCQREGTRKVGSDGSRE